MAMFAPAKRAKSKLRMALTGVSGSGKTLGALYTAFGMTGDWSKVALIDTEHGRAQFYADRSDLNVGAFLYAELTPPYSPERYIEAAREGAQAVGEDGVLIVDSLSHAWSAEGGVLDIKDQIARSGKAGMNDYTAWKDAGREQNTLINNLFALPCHLIVTMRVKTEYALEENERGRKQPVKLGLTPVQRADMEYEFDTVLTLTREHIATASKDVTFLDQYGQVITPELGRLIAGWLDSGAEPEKCAACGSTIYPDNGKTVNEILDGTLKFAGRKMCMKCFNAWFKTDKARQAQFDQEFTAMGCLPENRDGMLEALLAQVGAPLLEGRQWRFAADATPEQWAQAMKDMKGED